MSNGTAIIASGVSFRSCNLGRAVYTDGIIEPTEITLAEGARNGNEIELVLGFVPKNAIKGIVWRISDTAHFGIAEGGILMVKEGADNASVIVTATSAVDPTVSAQIRITGVTYKETVDELTGISISSLPVGDNRYKMSVSYRPGNTSYKGVSWEIVDGERYATIDSDGNLFVLQGAASSTVRVRASSVYDPSIFDDKVLVVSYVDSVIDFEDEKVVSILNNNGIGSNGRVTLSEAQAVTSLGTIFKQSDIESFDELEHFTGLTALENGAFAGCTSLRRVKLPINVRTLNGGTAASASNLVGVFNSCSSLVSVGDVSGLTSIGGGCFFGCSSLNQELHFDNLVSMLNSNVFSGVTIRNLYLPVCTNYGSNSINLSKDVKTYIYCGEKFGNFVSLAASHVNDATFDCGPNIKTLTYNMLGDKDAHKNTMILRSGSMVTFSGTRRNIIKDLYVPDALVDVYKADSGWAAEASNILPLSQYAGA